MKLSTYSVISYWLTDNQRGSLVSPVVATEFVAGLDEGSGQWRIIPLKQVRKFDLSSVASLSRKVQSRQVTLQGHLNSLVGQFVVCQLGSSKLFGQVIEIADSLLWLEQDEKPTAVVYNNCLSIWLWKTQTELF